MRKSGRAPAGGGDRARRVLRKEYLFGFRYAVGTRTPEEWQALEKASDVYAEMKLRQLICKED